MDEKCKKYMLIKKLHELTNNYIELEPDDLANAGEFSRLSFKIEEISMKLCLLGTNISEEELINFLDTKNDKNNDLKEEK